MKSPHTLLLFDTVDMWCFNKREAHYL